jgi:hypothetical protein
MRITTVAARVGLVFVVASVVAASGSVPRVRQRLAPDSMFG